MESDHHHATNHQGSTLTRTLECETYKGEHPSECSPSPASLSIPFDQIPPPVPEFEQNEKQPEIFNTVPQAGHIEIDLIQPPDFNDRLDPSLFDPDKKSKSISPSLVAYNSASPVDITTLSLSIQTMPHRIDSMTMHPTHRRDPNERFDNPYRRQTPPPINTVTHSPALSTSSLDRSTLSTPPPPRRHTPHGAMQSTPIYSSGSYHSEPPPMHNSRSLQGSQFPQRGTHMSQNYSYGYEGRYEATDSPDHTQYHVNSSVTNSHLSVPNMNHNSPSSTRENYGVSYPLPGQSTHSIIHTDDAATKLSDKVRRRCFNCCTTDTSTWRRSNLSPGKVLCNKCGLFERTHSRPRPEQFPHKRGPLASSTLRSRTPPPPPQSPTISQSSHSLPPYHYTHPSIAPLASVPDSKRPYHLNTLPEIQSWINEPNDHALAQAPTARRNETPHGRQSSPLGRMQNPSQARDTSSAREALA
jgi:hypothetical protein